MGPHVIWGCVCILAEPRAVLVQVLKLRTFKVGGGIKSVLAAVPLQPDGGGGVSGRLQRKSGGAG